MASHTAPGHYDDTDEISGEEDEDEDFSNSEITSDEEYSEEERMPHPDTDFLRFGNSLQVKGSASILMVFAGETDLFVRRNSNSRRRPAEKRREEIH